MAQLIIMDGPGVGTTFELANQNILGNGAKCNIRLTGKSISEEHARIYQKNNAFFIIPVVPGTLQINAQPLRQERKIIHGDMITIGDVMLLYGDEVPDTATRLPPEEEGEEEPVEEEPSSKEKSPTIKSRQRYFKDPEAAIQNINTTKQASHYMEVLLKVSNAMISKLELKELLTQLLDIIFENLPADRGTIFLMDPKANKLWPMATKKRDDTRSSSVPASGNKLMASRTIIKEVLETKEGILTKDAMEDERFQMGLSIAAQQIHAALCVPLVGKNDEVLGIINVDTTRSDRVFTDDHLRLVTGIAMQSSLAIENALLIQQLGEKKRIEQELTIASNIQQELLPKVIPKVAGIEVFGMMRPAKEVGGDYYDFITSDDNSDLYICIGDVSGKGVPAGLVMVMARCFFRPLIMSCKTTKTLLEELNKLLVADTRKDMFMSMLVIKWSSKTKTLSWTGAGHEHLIVYHHRTKKSEAIRAGGIVLGMTKQAEKFFIEQQLQLEPGDSILLYTDGVTECLNPQGKMLELANLQKLMEKYGHLTAQEVCNSLFAELQRFMSNAAQYDDITLVDIKLT